MPHAIFLENATPEEVLAELKTCAASGDLLGLQNLLQKWDSIADMSWFVPSLSEIFLQCADQIPDKRLALQRVLNAAAREGRTKVVAYLLDQHRCTVTRMAVKWTLPFSQWDVMQLFLDRGWDINSPIEGGNTCSVLRQVLLSETHVRWCLDHGADPMFRSAAKTVDVLSHAGKIGSVKILKILREYGADLTKSNVLHHAALGMKPGRVEVMTYLLDEAGVSINQREFEYDIELFEQLRGSRLGTALHKAVDAKCLETVKFLLDRGIDRNIEDTRGRKAVDLARMDGFLEALALLQ